MCQGNQFTTLSELVGCTILRQVTINDNYVAHLYVGCLIAAAAISLQEVSVACNINKVEGNVLIACTIICRNCRNDTCSINALSACASINSSTSISNGIGVCLCAFMFN